MAWETFPDSYTSPQNHSWIFETLWVIIFWVGVTHKMLNVNWEKIHSIILSLTCHGLRNIPLLIHIPSQFMKSPQNHSWIFETLWVIIFWVGVTHKMLNVNWEKIHSIILSLTCHGLRNFTPLIHIPSKPWAEAKFLKPWQVTDKIIEWIFSQFTFNILWVTLTQKIITHRVLKIHEWIWGDVYEWGKVS